MAWFAGLASRYRRQGGWPPADELTRGGGSDKANAGWDVAETLKTETLKAEGGRRESGNEKSMQP
jgi:hypothetical protein